MKRNAPEAPPTDSSRRTSRRDLLKRSLVVLGAAAIVQPFGGVVSGQETPKKDDSRVVDKTSPTSTAPLKTTQKTKKGHKGGKRKEETPKKDGGKIGMETPKKDG